MASIAAWLIAVALIAGACEGVDLGDPSKSPATEPRRRERPAPPGCIWGSYRMFRVSNRVFRCVLNTDDPQPDFMVKCPRGWKMRDLVTRQRKGLAYVVRWECYSD